MSNNEQQQITCAYGFDKLTPEQQRVFKDFLRYLREVKLYPSISEERKKELFDRIQRESELGNIPGAI